jgi:hypothetical protein
MNEIPNIVKRAMVNTVTDIGQLSKEEIKILNKYVKLGYLSKGKGGWFPVIKTVWACPNFDFEKQRNDAIEELYKIIKLDLKKGEQNG